VPPEIVNSVPFGRGARPPPLRAFGLDAGAHGDEHLYSREELRLIVHAKHASRAGEEYSMMQHALDLPDLVVGDVLRTRDQLAVLRDGMDRDAVLTEFRRSRYSRYPWFEADGDHVRGVLHMKDLLRAIAEHDVQVRDYGECEHECDHLGRLRADAQAGEQRFEQARECRFADPAEAERGERDAELAGRQIGVQMAVHVAEQASAPAAAGGQGRGLGLAQLDQREFGGDEEAVQQHQQQGSADVKQVLQHGTIAGNGCRF
jgi:CBS domain containing-hemolysin-like protein